MGFLLMLGAVRCLVKRCSGFVRLVLVRRLVSLSAVLTSIVDASGGVVNTLALCSTAALIPVTGGSGRVGNAVTTQTSEAGVCRSIYT